MEHYDVVVIGTGPAGRYGAIQAAKLGKRVVVIEKDLRMGGAAAVTGTIPSKSLREATLHLTGMRQRRFYGMNYRVKDNITLDDLSMTTSQVVSHELQVLEAQFRRNNIEVEQGRARFVGPNEVEIRTEREVKLVRGEKILIACGTTPARPPGVDFDGERVIDSNQILQLEDLPDRLTVVGAGVIGVEYACIYAALGVRVTVVNYSDSFLEFVDRQIIERLKMHMEDQNIEFRLGEKVVDICLRNDTVIAKTESNKEIIGDCLLYSIGRQGATADLSLDLAGLSADKRGRIAVNEHMQTEIEHIYAAGDVVGFPALASSSREQGRHAMSHAFGAPQGADMSRLPYGIYAIPEMSMIGPTEQQLTADGVPYEVGVARYREISRGQILGDTTGMLKLLFHRESHELIAVHVIGEGATELVHIGQAVIDFGGTIDYFVRTVFNYPTLAECYKVAALDGLNRIRGAQPSTESEELKVAA